MGFLDSLFGTGGSASQEQARTTAQTNYPDWYNRLQQANLLRAAEAAFEEYQPYGGPRMALAGPEQQAARAGFGGLAGIAAPSFAEAMRQSRLGATQLAGADITPFMSPFQQAVTDVALREARRQGDIQRRELESRATKAGAFGGSRAALEQAEAERNIQRGLADIQATGSQAAYESALAQLAADRAAAAAAAPQMAALGTGLQAALTSGLKEAELAGERERAERQGALDIAYQDYLTQRAYPMAQASGLQALLQGATVPGSTLSTTFGQPPSVGGQIGGLGLTALGALGSGGAFGPGGMLAGMFLKDGGEVSDDLKYQDGGAASQIVSANSIPRRNMYVFPPNLQWMDRALYLGLPTAPDAEQLQALLDRGIITLDPTRTTKAYEDYERGLVESEVARAEAPGLIASEMEAMIESGSPRSAPDVGFTSLLTEAMAADEDVAESEPEPDTDDGADDGIAAEVEDRGFDYEDLITAGLAMMQAAAQPGASVLGSASAGGLTALQAKKEEEARRREEDLARRKLDLSERELDILEGRYGQEYLANIAELQADIEAGNIEALRDKQSDILSALASINSISHPDLYEQLILEYNTINMALGGISAADLVTSE